MTGEGSAPTELTAREEGTGPPVLLVHGVGGDNRLWGSLFSGLADRFRVLAPDLRGHGKTSNPPGSQFSLSELEGDLFALLDRRSVDSVHLVGMSAGALLALWITLEHPERVRSLTMISGAAYTDSHTRSVLQRWEETYTQEGADALALRFLKDLYYPDWMEAHLDFADQVREFVARMDVAPVFTWSHAMFAFDEKGRIAQVKRPTLIIQAMDDALIDASHGRILRQSIPGAQIRILAQTGHMVPLERPEETREAIAEFVSAVEAKGPSVIPP
jgi:pimeloyl-ACP methyl ester carboxylesterase